MVVVVVVPRNNNKIVITELPLVLMLPLMLQGNFLPEN